VTHANLQFATVPSTFIVTHANLQFATVPSTFIVTQANLEFATVPSTLSTVFKTGTRIGNILQFDLVVSL
jgi:hypothetical protein